MPGSKRPVSVLVVIHTADLEVLLLERAAHPGYWQSVTGSLEADETPQSAARRETLEETGILAAANDFMAWQHSNRFELLPLWRDRYPAGTTHNDEHVYSLCLPQPLPIKLSAREHRQYAWLPWQEAAKRVFSWSNQDAILMLPGFPARKI